MANAEGVPLGGPSQPLEITRRQALKRGAILGGALVWATPVVQVIGMKPAFAQVASPVSDRVVTVQRGRGTVCYLVTQEELACFEERCAGQPGDEGCLNECLASPGIGQLEEVDCPTA